jgi:hypothetical protein
MRVCLLLLFLVFTPLRAFAGGPECPAKGGGEGWDPGCFTVNDGVRQLKPQYLSKLKFKKSGKAVILIEDPREVVAVDRRGRVVVPGIYHTGDFDYPSAPRGVARFESNGKCGFFQSRTFKILVPAEYDHCHSFHDGETARACKDCEDYCTEVECQLSVMVGGQGFDFNAKGQLQASYVLGSLEDACSHGIEKLVKEGLYRYLKCKDDPNHPFRLR